MPLPKQIQKQAEELAALEARNNPPQPEEVNPPAEPEPNPEPAPAPAPAPTDPRESDPEYWRARFQSLQGIVEANNDQYRAQVSSLTAQIETLTTQLRSMAQTRQEPPKPEVQDAPLVTDRDAEMFGADLVDMTKRAAKEVSRTYEKQISQMQALIDAQSQRLKQLTDQLGGVAAVQAESKEATFFDRLNAALPNWKELQATPECQQFLGERVPGTKLLWNNALTTAAENGDVDAVLEVFDAFKLKHPQYSTQGQQQQSQAQARAKDELSRQVAPARTSASTPVAQSKRIYTPDDFAREGMEIVRLRQHGKNQEAAQREAEMDAALAEGRVRPN